MHAWSTPPAFVLSQNQTLHKNVKFESYYLLNYYWQKPPNFSIWIFHTHYITQLNYQRSFNEDFTSLKVLLVYPAKLNLSTRSGYFIFSFTPRKEAILLSDSFFSSTSFFYFFELFFVFKKPDIVTTSLVSGTYYFKRTFCQH